jgi:hypothetical protein
LELSLFTRSLLSSLAFEPTVHRFDFPLSLPLGLAYLLPNRHGAKNGTAPGRKLSGAWVIF